MPRKPIIQSRLRLLWEVVSTSYWFLPANLFLAMLGVLAAALAADQAGWADATWLSPLLFEGGAESARSILGALSTSMIALTGTVFSLTIISLTLASGQFGPRLLRGFMRSKANQWVLGTFLCTSIYALLVLASVRNPDEGIVPRIAVSIAIVLAVANAALLIFFIHHVARSIHANNVAALAARNLRRAVDTLIPAADGSAEPPDEASRDTDSEPWSGPEFPVRGARRGYVLVVDEKQLVRLAEAHDWRLRLCARAGDFVSEHHPWIAVAASAPLGKEAVEALRDCFDIGSQRTIVQDFEAGLLELVEVAVRSLSPGINDPFTAIVCIDHLAAAISDLAGRPFPPRVLRDSADKPRVWRDVTDFGGVLDTAFNQIRQAGGRDMAVLVRLVEAIHRIAEITEDPERKTHLRRHLAQVVEAGRENLPQPSDIELLRRKATRDG